MEPERVRSDLVTLAAELEPADAGAAALLRDLAQALESDRPGRWAAVDLHRVFDVETLAGRLTPAAPPLAWLMRWLEVARNLLVLLPITLTWLALWAAAINFRAATSPPNPPTDASFLLLWERGFDGLGVMRLPFVHTFSQLARWDAILLGLLVLITAVIYIWRSFSEGRLDESEHAARQRIGRTLVQADMALGEYRYARLESNADNFSRDAQSFLARLAAAQAQADKLVARREREAADLTLFARDLAAATQPLPEVVRQAAEAAAEMRATGNVIHAAVRDLGQAQQTSLRQFAESQSEALTGLARAQDTATDHLAEMQRSMAGHLEELHHASLAQLTRLQGDSVAQLAESQAALTDAYRATGERLDALAGAFERSTKAQEASAAEVRKAALALAAGAVAFAASEKAVTDASRDIITDYRGLKEAIQSEHSALAEATGELRASSADVAAVAQRLDSALSRVERLERAVNTMTHLTALLGAEFETRDEQARAFNTGLQQAVDGLGQALSRLDGFEQRSLELFDRLAGQSERVQTLWNTGHEQWLRGVEKSGQQVAGALRSQSGELRDAVNEMRETLRTLQTEVIGSRELLAKYQESGNQQVMRQSQALTQAGDHLAAQIERLSAHSTQMTEIAARTLTSAGGNGAGR